MEMSIWVPIISTIGGVIVGWLLGFWITLKVEQQKRKQLGKDFKEGVYAELREALPRFVYNYYLLNQALGKTNRNILNWVHSMSSVADGELWKFVEPIEKLLKLSDGQLTALLSQSKDPMPTKSLKKFNLSFLEENLSSFSLLGPHFRRSILGIRTKITWLNEEIDLYYFYYKTTFASGLTQENWLYLDTNMKINYEHIAKLSRKIAEGIKDLILQEETESKNVTR